MNKKIDVRFAEGCFDDFEGTPEELAEFLAEIKNIFSSDVIPEGVEITKLSAEEEQELMEILESKQKHNTRQ
jgi:hypothetical protein